MWRNALMRAVSALLPTRCCADAVRRDESRRGTQECFLARSRATKFAENKGLAFGRILCFRGCVRHGRCCALIFALVLSRASTDS